MQHGVTDLGPSLRKVRTARGLTIEEAARDTRIRSEFLDAIENEDYERLLGDVHVRGCLRTYASYLRLSPDRVVDVYTENRPEPLLTKTPPPAQPEPIMGMGTPRRRDDHRLFVMVAATLLVLAAAFGVLSARQPAPTPADLPSAAPPLDTGSVRPITVRLSEGGTTQVSVNGTDYGVVGREGRPWQRTFEYQPASPSSS